MDLFGLFVNVNKGCKWLIKINMGMCYILEVVGKYGMFCFCVIFCSELGCWILWDILIVVYGWIKVLKMVK